MGIAEKEDYSAPFEAPLEARGKQGNGEGELKEGNLRRGVFL
jgi:hypothetical protein